MALLGLKAGDPLPPGGQSISVKVESGSGTAATWTDKFGPVFIERCGITLERGSLNLWATDPITWENPVVVNVGADNGQFCPLIVEECAIGVAFRKNLMTPRYLETLSPVHLRSRLNLSDGQWLTVRLLPGTGLGGCLTRA